MKDEQTGYNLTQTYLNAKGYFISTAYRKSSVIYAPGWYFETIVWTWNNKTKMREKIVYYGDSGSMPEVAYARHAEIVSRLVKGEELPE